MEELQFKKKGRNITIYPYARVIYPENISIGDETVIDDFAFVYGAGNGMSIGNFCHITAHCTVQSGGFLDIGDFTGIGPGSIILAGTDDYQGNGFIGLKIFGEKYRNLQFKDTTLGRHVHIGAGSIILPGVAIGDGCSVGAGSLVTKDLPEWTICFGSPCKPAKDKPRERQLKMEKEFLGEYYGKKAK